MTASSHDNVCCITDPLCDESVDSAYKGVGNTERWWITVLLAGTRYWTNIPIIGDLRRRND